MGMGLMLAMGLAMGLHAQSIKNLAGVRNEPTVSGSHQIMGAKLNWIGRIGRASIAWTFKLIEVG
jgi:hypothetical protein